MTKKQRLEYVKELLSNEYGVFGRERVDWQTLYFSESVIKKMGIEKGEGKTIIHEAYLSDTPSGVAVNNKFGDSIDFMELTEMEAFKVGQLVEWKRNKAYRDLC